MKRDRKNSPKAKHTAAGHAFVAHREEKLGSVLGSSMPGNGAWYFPVRPTDKGGGLVK